MPFAFPRLASLLFLGLLTAAPLAAQTPPELRALAARPDVWPREVKLSAPAVAGRATLPAGQTLKVIGLEGSSIVLDYQGSLVTVPVAQTNFLSLATPELARRPAPTRPAPPAPPPPAAARPPGATPPPAAAAVNNELGARLDNLLVRAEGESLVRLPLGSLGLARKRFLLLQFGGGPKWPGIIAAMNGAVQQDKARRADFELVSIPLLEASVEDTVRVAKVNGISWPMLDPREQSLVHQLWTQYGHAGSFALALVDANGKVVAQTEATRTGAPGKFQEVLGELAKIPVAGQP